MTCQIIFLIADTANFVVRYVNRTTRIISTIAGYNVNGNSGDGLPSKQSSFSSLFGITTDMEGNVYIVDAANSVVRILIKTCDSLLFTCNNHGSCLSSQTCKCNYGWSTETCIQPTCFGVLATTNVACSGHGKCSYVDLCECDMDFFGSECEFFKCYGINYNNQSVCSNGRGNCSSPNNCTCQNNYFGNECELTTCYGIESNNSKVCSGNGKCVGKDECSCMNGYVGDYCQHTVCFGIYGNETCSSRGSCIAPDNCECLDGYGGRDCRHYEVFMDFETVSIHSSHHLLMRKLTSDLLECGEIVSESDILKLGEKDSLKCYWRELSGFRIYLGYNHNITHGSVLNIMNNLLTIHVNASISDQIRKRNENGVVIGFPLDVYPTNKDLLIRSQHDQQYNNFKSVSQKWKFSTVIRNTIHPIQELLDRNDNKPIVIIPSLGSSITYHISVDNQ